MAVVDAWASESHGTWIISSSETGQTGRRRLLSSTNGGFDGRRQFPRRRRFGCVDQARWQDRPLTSGRHRGRGMALANDAMVSKVEIRVCLHDRSEFVPDVREKIRFPSSAYVHGAEDGADVAQRVFVSHLPTDVEEPLASHSDGADQGLGWGGGGGDGFVRGPEPPAQPRRNPISPIGCGERACPTVTAPFRFSSWCGRGRHCFRRGARAARPAPAEEGG